MTSPSWPRDSSCHGAKIPWVDYEANDGSLRRLCKFCRGLHPGDLFEFLNFGCRLLPIQSNPYAAGFVIGEYRWFPQHLQDEGYNPDAKATLKDAILRSSGFWFEEGHGGPVRWGFGGRQASSASR